MKGLTNAQRISSVDFELRQKIIDQNAAGTGMKNLANIHGIAERTIRAIVHHALGTEPLPTRRVNHDEADMLWRNPRLWPEYGLRGPTTYRMV